jgi:hypothetical protein
VIQYPNRKPFVPVPQTENSDRRSDRIMVDVGQVAPDFTLPAQDMRNISLSDYMGKKTVVLSFHIFSFTGG